jgi:hypothetical protein
MNMDDYSTLKCTQERKLRGQVAQKAISWMPEKQRG